MRSWNVMMAQLSKRLLGRRLQGEQMGQRVGASAWASTAQRPRFTVLHQLRRSQSPCQVALGLRCLRTRRSSRNSGASRSGPGPRGGDSLRWSGLVRSAFPQRCAGARRWGTPRRCGLSPNAASGLGDGGPDRRQGGGPQRDKGEGWTPDGGQAQEEWDGPQPLVPFEIPRA